MSFDVVTCDNTESVRIIRKSAILRHKDLTDYYRYIFNQCDSNGDGKISTLELKDFLATNEGDIPDEVVRCLYNKFDTDHDSQFNFEEFLEFFNHPTVTETFKRIGSRYLKFVAESSIRKKSLKLRRTVTDTGLYEEQFAFNLGTISIIALSVLQIMCYYIDKYDCNHCITNSTKYDPKKKYEIWRFATFILDHSDNYHIYGNVIIQLLLGVPLEMVHSWRVPLIYLAGAIGGCLMHGICDCNFTLVGGSPGLYSFYSAHVATVIMNWREMSHPVVHLVIFGILVGFDAIRNCVLSPSMNVSYFSHIGGVVVGLPMGVIVLRNIKITDMENIIWYTCLGLLCLLGTVLIISIVVIDVIGCKIK